MRARCRGRPPRQLRLAFLALSSLFPGALGCCPHNCNFFNAAEPDGKCNVPTCTCECKNGQMGGDCALKICPSHKAWDDVAVSTDNAHNEAECSNRGLCDREAGVCECMEGFGGLACQRLLCQSECSSHGQCLSMRYWATQKDPGRDITDDTQKSPSIAAHHKVHLTK